MAGRISRLFAVDDDSASSTATVVEGKNKDGSLPFYWNFIWSLPFLQPTPQGSPPQFSDSALIFKSNIEQIYGSYPSYDLCPMAEGALDDIASGTMFIGLQQYFNANGSPYKLCFGPKSFLVISDPVQAKHVLKDFNVNYDKGVLAEILEPIMGKGLIPADPETWKVRRKQIVPGFHKAWLEHMVGLFGYCNLPLLEALEEASNEEGELDMEEKFCSVALDIIGKSVFNYDFGSVTEESPVVKAVYSALLEAEHRSMTPAPYWDIPLANQVVPRLRKFNGDLKVLDDVLTDLINRAKNSRQVEDIEELEARNYKDVKDPSLLRFLVDMRGADIDNKQLRDDLMTMLIAGHETTAAVLTWGLFELTRNKDMMKRVREEIDEVVGDRMPTMQDCMKMKFLRLVVAETLRMYPEPPLLIRRCRTDDVLPRGAEGNTGGARIKRGMDMFLSIYNIHRSELYWEKPDTFDPDRFTRPFKNDKVEGWAGFDPSRWEGRLYPTETAADYAYLPFGGGARKCVGDEFAYLESCVTLAMVLRRFDFDFPERLGKGEVGYDEHPKDLKHPVGMRTGATIHTRQGLVMNVKKRVGVGGEVVDNYIEMKVVGSS